jgi:small-conductance mechanosensitive channel
VVKKREECMFINSSFNTLALIIQINVVMETLQIQIIETIFIFIGYIVTLFITNTFINNTLKETNLKRGRRKVIVKAVQLFSFITLIVLLSAVWGLEQNEIAVFVGTIITALGIAFFASWSLLSNVTSSLLLFFNHPINIGDTIKILDKEYPFEGEITDLTYFFIHLKNAEGEIITIPNSLLLQKAIAITVTKK